MIRKKNEIIGGYVPAFFEMQVNCPMNNFDLNNLSDKDLSVFFHEYIHFLQDITTTYGLNNIYVYSEYLSSVLNRIYKLNKPSTFDVPYQINDNNDNVLLNKQICDGTLGDSELPDSIHISHIDNIVVDDFVLVSNHNLPNIKQVILCLKNDKNEDEFYTFGASVIMENMAYLMERLCFANDYIKSPDYPYTVAEKVSDFYVNGFSKNSEMVLALCDMCLMTSNPAQIYVEVMQGISKGNLKFNKPEDIYDHFYSLTSKSVYGDVFSFIEGFKRMFDKTLTKMKSYIVNSPMITGDFYDWINKIEEFVNKFRVNDRYYFLRLAKDFSLKTNNCFSSTLNSIGSPIITDKNKQHYFKIPHGNCTIRTDVEYFKAIGQIIDLFEQGNKPCSLYDWCKTSNVKTNNQCLSEPWKIENDMDLCFYRFLWKHWNLSDYTPVKSSML